MSPVFAATENIDYPLVGFNSVGEFIGSLVMPAFAIGGIMLTFYIVIGAFKYMTSGGDKQAVADARNMIIHAIIGFVGLMVLFLIVKFLQDVFHVGVTVIR